MHSGMLDSRDPIDGQDKGLPVAALRRQNFLALRSQSVIAPPSLAGLFDPAPLNPAALFQPVQQRIKGCHIEAEHPFRPRLYQFPDLVTVAGPGLDQ